LGVAHQFAAVDCRRSPSMSTAQARSSDADQAPSSSASQDRGGKAPSVWSRLRSALLPGAAPATDASDTLLPRAERASAVDVAHLSWSQVRCKYSYGFQVVKPPCSCCRGSGGSGDPNAAVGICLLNMMREASARATRTAGC